MKYDSPRHRGATSITETKDARRKYFKPSLRCSLASYYSGLKSAHDAELAAIKELDRIAQLEFCQDVSDINFLKLQHSKLFKRSATL